MLNGRIFFIRMLFPAYMCCGIMAHVCLFMNHKGISGFGSKFFVFCCYADARSTAFHSIFRCHVIFCCYLQYFVMLYEKENL